MGFTMYDIPYPFWGCIAYGSLRYHHFAYHWRASDRPVLTMAEVSGEYPGQSRRQIFCLHAASADETFAVGSCKRSICCDDVDCLSELELVYGLELLVDCRFIQYNLSSRRSPDMLLEALLSKLHAAVSSSDSSETSADVRFWYHLQYSRCIDCRTCGGPVFDRYVLFPLIRYKSFMRIIQLSGQLPLA